MGDREARQPRFLVVDDEPDILLIVGLNLRRWGFDARTVGTTTEADAECRAWRPDVLFLDLSMPGLDGLQFLAQLRSVGITPPSVVLMSALPNNRLAALAEEHSVGFLAKPFGLADLRASCARATASLGLPGPPAA